MNAPGRQNSGRRCTSAVEPPPRAKMVYLDAAAQECLYRASLQKVDGGGIAASASTQDMQIFKFLVPRY